MGKLSHFTPGGASRMVDVGGKEKTERVAVAHGTVRMLPETLRLIQDRKVAKGDVLEVARLAGIMAAKQTPHLVPLCHPIALTKVEVEFDVQPPDAVTARATVRATDRTGVEMEALTAVAVCCLTLYDMVKSVDRGMTITNVQLVEKSGGKSGRYVRAR